MELSKFVPECFPDHCGSDRKGSTTHSQIDYLCSQVASGEQYHYGPEPLADLTKELSQQPSTESGEAEPTAPIASCIDFMHRWDRVAMYLQARHFRQLRYICITVLGFLVCFELYAHLNPVMLSTDLKIPIQPSPNALWPILLVGLGLLAISGWLLRGGSLFPLKGPVKSRQLQIAYLDSRCIAEMTRILTFWRLNGIEDRIADLAPRTYGVRLEIVRAIMHRFEQSLSQKSTDVVQRKDLSRKHWELDQVAYFHTSHEKEHLRGAFWLDLSTLFFWTGLLGIFALVWLAARGVPREGPFVELLLTFSPCFIVGAAIAEFYLDRRGFEANSARYAHAEEIFRSLEVTGKSMREVCRSPHETEERRYGLVVTLIGTGGVLAVATWQRSLLLEGVAALIPLVWALVSWQQMRKKVRDCNISKEQKAQWLAERTLPPDDEKWKSHIRSIGREALTELIHWYISASDRVVTLPKG